MDDDNSKAVPDDPAGSFGVGRFLLKAPACCRDALEEVGFLPDVCFPRSGAAGILERAMLLGRFHEQTRRLL